MKLLKYVTGSLFLYFLLFSSTTQLAGCSPDPIFDTVYVKDTLIVKDTLTIRDTVDCNCYDLKAGLVAWYNFNGGNLNDSSGKNNHIVFSNATQTTGRNGKPNSAYLFNGTSSYMRVANSTSLNPAQAITLAAIVKLNGFYQGTCHNNNILSKLYGSEYNNGYYALRISDQSCTAPLDTTRMKFVGAYGDNQNGGPFALTDTTFAHTNSWYSIVYTFESGKSKLYVNGQLMDAREYPNYTFTPNPSDLFIGKSDMAQYPFWFNGAIDDIRIYDRALCDGEVKQLNRLKD